MSQAPPTLFLLSFLGGTASQWEGVRQALPAMRCVPVDLPGFGDAAALPGTTVAALADHVAAAIRREAPARWAIAGHSMGAKVATVLAFRAEGGEPGLEGLSHLVTLAGSPPGPEPMDEIKRRAMRDWFRGDPARFHEQAAGYIGDNTGLPLDPEKRDRAVAEVLRSNPGAWRAWLDGGSKEDWAGRVGRLQTPTLLIAGGADDALGADAQARLVAPSFASVRLAALPGVGHLAPLECPEAVAGLIAHHLGVAALDPAYLALILSPRVSTNTRAALLGRLPDPAPATLSPPQLATLAAICARVVPDSRLELAPRIDEQLAKGDGWRFDALPPDAEAFRTALDDLAGFTAQDVAAQDATLATLAEGTWQGRTAADRMKLWFEDLRDATVRAFVAHPATLARIGYSGIAYGGDGAFKPGFAAVGLGKRDAWEPEPVQ